MTVAGTSPSAAHTVTPARPDPPHPPDQPQRPGPAQPAGPAETAGPAQSVDSAQPANSAQPAGPDGQHQPHELLFDPGDPLADYLLSAGKAVDIRELTLNSSALAALQDAGVVLLIPLISAGTLAGVLSLGPRQSEQDYSAGDRRLLSVLAGHAAPALRVGQLVRRQQAEARRSERTEQQLKVAQVIQQRFLPSNPPALVGWQLDACYQPALTVGGDFYDFIPLPGGRVMVVVGDVTDKGVPAALVMASAHAMLRSAAPRLITPGAVLSTVNDQLCQDTPEQMFVTCLALVLDPATGQVTFANAGHDVPYVHTAEGVGELRARGMPLGLMPRMSYEEKSFVFRPGEFALLHSDGLAEAHGPDREMFGFHRVAELVGRAPSGDGLIEESLAALAAFTGPGHEQEDDITLVCIRRTGP